MAEIVLDGVKKRFADGFEAVKDMNLDISDGEFMILVGPSGCGKSTALRMIAGLEDITEGVVKIGDQVVNDLAPKDRDIAMVFQNYALYPHMTVAENMSFGLRLKRYPKAEIKRVHQKVRTTTVYVTHDQVEAMTLADRVVVMNHGRIEQIGTPNELYHKPATKFVASFIGSPAMNFIPCRLEDIAGKLHVRLTDRIVFPLPPARAARYQGIPRTDKLLLGLRPEHITEAKQHTEPGVETFDTVLDVTEPMGMETLIYFTMEGTQVCGRVNPNAGAHDGGPLRLAVDLNNMHLLNEVTGVVL